MYSIERIYAHMFDKALTLSVYVCVCVCVGGGGGGGV